MILFEDLTRRFQQVQDVIRDFLYHAGELQCREELWKYHKGTGGGISRIWENGNILEKGGVNFSSIGGKTLPSSALSHLETQQAEFKAAGVSLVWHPHNPFMPTIHLNIRYFETASAWWFGGGVDLTPYYPEYDDVVQFHRTLKNFCNDHHEEYHIHKETCDRYFYLPHRGETRGVGGIFFDKKQGDATTTADFVFGLGYLLPKLYEPFLKYRTKSFNETQKEFQRIRQGRYVEFNLLFDRGTKFGIESEGRTESILMSLPSEARWKYNWQPEQGSREAMLIKDYLTPRDWV